MEATPEGAPRAAYAPRPRPSPSISSSSGRCSARVAGGLPLACRSPRYTLVAREAGGRGLLGRAVLGGPIGDASSAIGPRRSEQQQLFGEEFYEAC